MTMSETELGSVCNRTQDEKLEAYNALHAELREHTPANHGCLALGSYATFLAERAAGYSAPDDVISVDEARALYDEKLEACTTGALAPLTKNGEPRCGLMSVARDV